MPLTLVKYYPDPDTVDLGWYEWTDRYGNAFRGAHDRCLKKWAFWVKIDAHGYRLTQEQMSTINFVAGTNITYDFYGQSTPPLMVIFSTKYNKDHVLAEDGWCGPAPTWWLPDHGVPLPTTFEFSVPSKRCKRLQFGPYPASSIEDLKPQAISAARKEISSTFRAWPRCVNDSMIEHALRLEEQSARLGPTYMVYVQCPECK